MKNLATCLLHDDAGFVVSAELVLVATVGVLMMVVGLAEVQHGVNEELEDVGSAFGAMNQTFASSGMNGHAAVVFGSRFTDHFEFCDSEFDIHETSPRSEKTRCIDP